MSQWFCTYSNFHTRFINGIYLQTSWRLWNANSYGLNYVVPARTLLIVARNGRIASFDWAPTRCFLSDCVCIDEICGAYCGAARNCDLTVRVAWAGTDGAMNQLTSYASDIYRLSTTV